MFWLMGVHHAFSGCRLRQQAALLQEAVRVVTTVGCRQLAARAEAAGSGGVLTAAKTGGARTVTLEMCPEHPWQAPLYVPGAVLPKHEQLPWPATCNFAT